MNVLTQIRDYIKSTIREVNPRMVEIDQAHTPDVVGTFKFNETYFLNFSDFQIEFSQGFNSYDALVNIEIGAKAGSDVIAQHDRVVCDALGVAGKLSDLQRFSGLFNSVFIQNVTPIQVDGNLRYTKVNIGSVFNYYTKE